MHITLEADYAIRIVYTLAQTGKITDAGTIAQTADVTLRFTLKILRKLSAAGIVRSQKGSKGGYMLAKDASEISIYDIVYATSGTYNLSRCLDEKYECQRRESVGCKIQPIFEKISLTVREELSKYKIGDLVDSDKKN